MDCKTRKLMTIYRALHVHPQADVQVCVDQLFFKRAETLPEAFV